MNKFPTKALTKVGVLKFGFYLYNDFRFALLALKFVEIIYERWPFSVATFFNLTFSHGKERGKFLCGNDYITYTYA